MNFLEIAKRVRQEVGYSGVGPTSVKAQVGVYAKVVDWVKSAAESIHLSREQWRFDWARLVQELVEAKVSYSLADDWDIDVRSLMPGSICIWQTAQGGVGRTWPDEMPWEHFRNLDAASVSGIPMFFSLSPDHAIHFYPAPMAGLTMALEYYRNPQQLSENADVPRIPVQYHMAIVWSATLMAAEHDENGPLQLSAARKLSILMTQMERTEMPSMVLPEPMA